MSLSKRVGESIVAIGRAITLPIGARRQARALAYASDLLTPFIPVSTKYGEIRMRCRTLETTRVSGTGLAWEPETFDWIDRYVTAGSCVWDIGAHIGLFAMYSGLKLRNTGGQVLAFEPSFTNYEALNGNIFVNGLSDTVTAYCIAMSSRSGADKFHMQDPWAGGVLNAYGKAENLYGAFAPKFSHGAISFSMDEAVTRLGLQPPDHVKIDVDSIEAEILEGGRETLTRVSSVLIEMEESRSAEWVARIDGMMAAAGLHKHLGHSESKLNVLYRRDPV